MAGVERSPHPYARGELVVVIDCDDLSRAASFWSGVLGYVPETGQAPDDATYRTLVPEDGHGVEILLQRTADAKRAKNRVHLDLRTRELAAEVERVTALGAVRLTEEPLREYGWAWHVLADPAGNEFCVLQPPEGYWGGTGRLS